MHYKIYIPGARGYGPEHLARVGLADLIDPGCSIGGTDVSCGPDGAPGVVFHWGDESPPGFHRDAELWTKCKPRGDLKAGRFWMGQTQGSPPRPGDLLRSRHLGGSYVQLADGQQWLSPTVKLIPHNYTLDDDGQPVRRIKPEYQAWVDRGTEYFDLMLQWRQNQGGDLTVPQAWKFAIDSLAMNYRVNADIASWLGLLDDETILLTIIAVLETRTLEEIDAQKKTAHLSGIRPVT